MDSEAPLPGLFPESHNLQIAISRKESLIERPEDSEDAEKSAASTDTINTDILQDIIEGQHWHDIQTYKEQTANQRFCLTELYAKKNNITFNEMIVDKSKPQIYSNGLNDFTNYNLKVQKEYELREKLESLLQKQTYSDLRILNEEAVRRNYASDDAVSRSSKNNKPRKLLRMTSSLYKRFFPRKRTDGRVLDNFSRTSSNTNIIDNASHGNMAINEGVGTNRHHEATHDSRSSELSTLSKSGSQKIGLFERVDKHLNSPGHAKYHVQRKLRVRHIQMIGIGACISVGICLTSGKAFSIAGPFGTLLGFAISGSVVFASLLSFTELASLIPVSSGFSGLASRFVEDAFGFALGWTYWFSSMIALPAQVVASTFFLSYYSSMKSSRGSTAGFVTLFLFYPIFINLLDVRLMGEVIYVTGLIKIMISVVVIISMLIFNAGHGGASHDQVGFRYWDSSKSFSQFTFGLFRPTFDLNDAGEGSTRGIEGATGRFLAVISVILISTFAYSGVEMTFVASGEAINPRKTIPSAIKRTLNIVIIIYMLSLISVGVNIYCGDPRLLSYFSGSAERRFITAMNDDSIRWQVSERCRSGLHYETGYQRNGSSPWVLALQNFGMCTYASVLNGIMIFITIGAEISSLFSGSRTLYAMAVQRKAPAIFQRCTKAGVPYVSVLFTSAFGAISYLAVDTTAIENFGVLTNISSASTSIIWMGLNVSFLRFYYALKLRQDIISRDDRSYPYRSPFQPYLSLYGLFGCFMFVLFMGYTNFLQKYWNTKSFFSAYGGLMLFSACYLGYKIIGTSKIQRLDQLDMDTGRREMDRIMWNEYRQYSGPYRERAKKLFTWLY